MKMLSNSKSISDQLRIESMYNHDQEASHRRSRRIIVIEKSLGIMCSSSCPDSDAMKTLVLVNTLVYRTCKNYCVK